MPLKVRGPSLPSVSAPGPRPCALLDKCLQRAQRRIRFDQQAERAACNEGDRNEVLLRVVGQRLEQVRIGHQRGGGCEVEGAAIGAARAAACAPIVFWPPGLLSITTGWPPQRTQSITDQPRHVVGP